MARKALILLCILCMVMCAFIGTLSKTEASKDDKISAEAVAVKCEVLVDKPPVTLKRFEISKFAPGRHWAHLDFDHDEKWDALCVPIFPKKVFEVSHHYRGVLVSFKGVETREQLVELLKSDSIDVTFRPDKQQLDSTLHSLLAQSYKRLDIEKCPVVFYGVESSNPVLGSATLQMSKYFGMGAAGVLVLTLLSFVFFRKKKDMLEEESPSNLARLPIKKEASSSPTSLATSGLFDKLDV